MSMTAHHALAARIEAADGPSRELDLAIWHFYWRAGVVEGWRYDLEDAPAYTSDLNAAYDLAKRLAPGLGIGTVWLPSAVKVQVWDTCTLVTSSARPDQHLALAICAAAVKAFERTQEADHAS